jgi:hypothetical protein
VIDIDKTIDAFRRGTFDVDCTSMVLRQRKEGGRRYEGRGYVRQVEGGALEFKLYVEKKENARLPAILERLTDGASGGLYSDGDLYDLTATSVDGTCWEAARILEPSSNWNMQDDTGVLNGSLHLIAAGPMPPPMTSPFLRLHFFEEYELPLNAWSPDPDRPLQGLARDHAQLQACGATFEVRSRVGSGDTVVTVTAETPFPPAFDLRIQEALQYVTGKSAIWRARVENCQGMTLLELASPRPQAAHTQFDPPISPTSIDFHHHTWELFDRFLSYVVANTDPTGDDRYWNSVAYHLYMARESTAASVDAWAVGVSVAVEALTSLAKAPEDAEPNDGWAKFRQAALAWIDEHPKFPEGIKKRAQGLIGGSADKGAKQILRELAGKNRVDRGYVDAWDKLRNGRVHPNLVDLRLPGAADYRELYKRLQQVGILLHQLTFHLIGYEGPFTDYGGDVRVSRPYPLIESEAGESGSRRDPS